jgi:hypothetical protein
VTRLGREVFGLRVMECHEHASTENHLPTRAPEATPTSRLATWRAPLSCASVEIVVLRVLLPGVIESAMYWHKKCTYLLWSLDKCASSLFVLLASFKS